jgi:hypothetical protein
LVHFEWEEEVHFSLESLSLCCEIKQNHHVIRIVKSKNLKWMELFFTYN